MKLILVTGISLPGNGMTFEGLCFTQVYQNI